MTSGPLSVLRYWFTRPLFAAVASAYLLFAFARGFPVNVALPESQTHHGGDMDRRVTAVWDLANERAALPFFEVKNRFLWRDRNPALFAAVSEGFVRMGFASPMWNQLFAALLVIAGLAFCSEWVLRLFNDPRWVWCVLGFLISTPFLLNEAGSISWHPYAFLGFHLGLAFWLRYLVEGRARDLLWVAAGYFLVCQNYWMYVMSFPLLAFGIQWARGVRFSRTAFAVIAGTAVLSFGALFLQVAHVRGGLDEGAHRMADAFVSRTVDRRIEGTRWHQDREMTTGAQFLRYPLVVFSRVRESYLLTLPLFLVLLGLAYRLTPAAERGRFRYFVPLLLAGLSWHLLMIQHTYKHHFSASYGHFAWMLVFSAGVLSIWDWAGRRSASSGWKEHGGLAFRVACVAPIVVFFGVYGFGSWYLKRLFIYWANVIS